MNDSKGRLQRTLRIKPLWDRTGSVSVGLDEERRELVVTSGGEFVRVAFHEWSAERLGWVEHRGEGGRARLRRVPVGDVPRHYMREWEAEQLVLELSRLAAERAVVRSGRWSQAGRRLADQVREGGWPRRISTVPFQVLLEHRSEPESHQALSATLAPERVYYLTAAGQADTQRLRRRSGLAPQRGGRRGGSRWQRSVRYETGVALCRAVGVDPVELGR